MKEMISYKFRLRPTPAQKYILSRWMGACRFVYNAGLEQRELAYQMTGKGLSYISQQNELPECKRMQGFEWLSKVPSQSLQMALRNLDRAYKNFFEGRGQYPKKKKKGKSTDSVSFPQGDRLTVHPLTGKKSLIFGIPKIKEGLKIIQHRKILGKIKTAAVTFLSGKWYLSLSCEYEKEQFVHSYPCSHVGIDLGVAKSICTEQAEYHLNVDGIKKLERQIAVLQRRMSKQEKFSSSWRKEKKKVAKKYSKISRMRKDFLHKVSHELCKNHAVICMENLKVKNMSKSASGTLEKPGKNVAAKSGLNRSILRQGWGMFRQFCEYKTQRYGGDLILVNPQNTSRRCSECGHQEASNRKTQSDFCCCNCGHNENADRNAAKNIKALGLQSLGLLAKTMQTLEAPTIAALAV